MSGANDELLKQLRAAAAIPAKPRVAKLMSAPTRLLWSKALEQASRTLDKPIKAKAKTFFGADMTVVFPELVSCFIYRYGFFEENLTTIILEHVRPGMTFYDIGTHFGFFSLLGSHLVGAEGRVHSFEPTPSTFGILSENTSPRPNVTRNNVALWSHETELEFQDYGIRFSAFNSLYGAKCMDITATGFEPKKYKVKTVSVDKYVADTGARPDFIKMDAESAEFDILQGMEKTLRDIRPVMTIEVGDFDSSVDFKDSRDSVVFLVERGYRVYEFADGRIVEHSPKDSYRYNNLLFLPE